MTAIQSPRRSLPPDDQGPTDRPWWIAVGVTAAVIAVVAGLLVLRSGAGDGGEVAVVGTVRSTTSTTEAPATTDPAPPATSAPPATAAPDPAPPATSAPPATAPTPTPTTDPPPAGTVDLPTAIWPPTTGDVRFDDPAAVARSFAVYWLKMTDPQVGAFRQGDARSGEVPLTPFADGPETTVLVRQLTDDGAWWVTGAASDDIVVTAPTAGGVTSPLHLAGQARAFEGTVQVGVYVQDSTAPIARTFVTGGGDQLRPFEGTVEFDAGSARYGAVAFAEYSENDGRLLHVTVVPVTFDAG